MPFILSQNQSYEKIKLKQCQFPECKEYFNGRGFSKYCFEHRKRQYRKIIDKLHKKIIITENPNQIYKHENSSVLVVTFTCLLCQIPFSITVYPNIFIYPKYCEEHRNEHKRLLWQKTHNNIIIPAIPVIDAAEKIPIDKLPEIKEADLICDDETFTDFDDDLESIFEDKEDLK